MHAAGEKYAGINVKKVGACVSVLCRAVRGCALRSKGVSILKCLYSIDCTECYLSVLAQELKISEFVAGCDYQTLILPSLLQHCK